MRNVEHPPASEQAREAAGTRSERRLLAWTRLHRERVRRRDSRRSRRAPEPSRARLRSAPVARKRAVSALKSSCGAVPGAVLSEQNMLICRQVRFCRAHSIRSHYAQTRMVAWVRCDGDAAKSRSVLSSGILRIGQHREWSTASVTLACPLAFKL